MHRTLLPPPPQTENAALKNCPPVLLHPDWCLYNTGNVLLARSQRGKPNKKKLMQPPHLMIGKLQYIQFLGLILLYLIKTWFNITYMKYNLNSSDPPPKKESKESTLNTELEFYFLLHCINNMNMYVSNIKSQPFIICSHTLIARWQLFISYQNLR